MRYRIRLKTGVGIEAHYLTRVRQRDSINRENKPDKEIIDFDCATLDINRNFWSSKNKSTADKMLSKINDFIERRDSPREMYIEEYEPE